MTPRLAAVTTGGAAGGWAMISRVAQPSPGPAHPEIVRLSLDRYRAGLLARRHLLGPAAQRATGLLLETIDAALDRPATMTADEVRFTATSLTGVGPEELTAFVNEYTLGVGWDGAPVVVMGTEPAENPDLPEDVAFHALYSVLVAAGSRPEILDRVVDGTSWLAALPGSWNSRNKRAWHLNPNDFIHVESRRGTPTWKVIAQVVAPGSADGWRELLETRLDRTGLGWRAYQIDRSALPAMRSSRGQPPTEERIGFLVEVLGSVRETAHVLLLHGFGGAGRWKEWWARDQRLIRTFLGWDEGQPVELVWRKVGRHSLAVLRDWDRRVVYARALNWVGSDYVEAVRAEVHA